MNFKFAAVALAMAVATGLAAAQEETPPIPLMLSPTGEGMFGTTFTQNVSGFFLDTYTIALPQDFSGKVTVNLVPEGPINFSSALLNDEGFGYFPESAPPNFEFSSVVSGDMPVSLQVLGFAGDAMALDAMDASYTGTITAMAVAAIPEPETYALMLVGLACIGIWSRRRRA